MSRKKSVGGDPKRPRRKPIRGKRQSIKNSIRTPQPKPKIKPDSAVGRNKGQLFEDIARDLSQKRSSLLQDVAESQDEMKAIFEQQESELEESAQKDRITRLTSRLKDRDRQKIREIDAALERLAVGTYGECEKCEREIRIERLRVLPTTTLCIDCAAARESKKRPVGAEEPSEHLRVRDRDREEEE